MTKHKVMGRNVRYDEDTKTVYQDTGLEDIVQSEKTWKVDPHLQMIRLLTDIKILLSNQLKRTAPYHTGPQQVTIAAPLSPVSPDPEPSQETAENSPARSVEGSPRSPKPAPGDEKL